MKNIYLLPTQNNNSKLASYTYDESKNVKIGEIGLQLENSSGWTNCWSPRELYITSDEEIGEGDWMYYKHFGEDILTKYNSYGGQNTNVNEHKDYYKKIILSTDLDLIKDGVQKIKDDFLQWFVKNPSCEKVDIITTIVNKESNYKTNIGFESWRKEELKQILGVDFEMSIDDEGMSVEIPIIKQERLSTKLHIGEVVDESYPESFRKQQETVEEAAQSYAKIVNQNHTSHMLGFLNGAKWAQEKSYSEKELLNILQHRDAHMNNYHKLWSGFQTPKEWLEHFKNK